MSETIDTHTIDRRGARAAARPRRRRPLARRRLRRARPLLRHQPARLPDRVRSALTGRRHRPAALPRGLPRDPGRARRRVDRRREDAYAARPALAPPRRRLARLRRALRALRGELLARQRKLLVRGGPGRRGADLVARVDSRPARRRRHPSRPRAGRTAPPCRSGAPRPPKRPSLFAPVIGALLAASGLFGLLVGPRRLRHRPGGRVRRRCRCSSVARSRSER